MGEEVKSSRQESRAGKWLYALTVSLMVTFLGVLAISFTMSRLHFGSDVLRGLCLTLEAVSAFAGAMLLGKRMMSRRFLWGLLLGLIYFLVLFLAGRILSGSWNPEAMRSAGPSRRRRNAGGNVLCEFCKKIEKNGETT